MTPDPSSESQAQALAALARAYAQAWQAASLRTLPPCIVVLHIGAQLSGIAVGQAAQPAHLQLLPLGAERTARELFRSAPPTPLALEHAIAVVEDAVMPLRPLVPRTALLFSPHEELGEIARLAGLAPDARQLSLEAMEDCFNRLAAVVQGAPAAQQGLPESNAFSARLLILREFMHHLQFPHITFLHAH